MGQQRSTAAAKAAHLAASSLLETSREKIIPLYQQFWGTILNSVSSFGPAWVGAGPVKGQ